MSAAEPSGGGPRTGALLASAFFVVLGIVALIDTASYTDVDSKVFPRAAAILLIVCATASLLRDLVGPRDRAADEGFGPGSWWRRVLLVAAMLGCCALMPLTGFLPASAVAFAGGLLAAMHDRWSVRTIALYWGSGALIMAAFYTLFRHGLNVPLP